MKRNKRTERADKLGFRDWIAVVVILVSVICLTFVACVAVSNSNNQSETAQMIFNALLPLLGTWVGTVLAFYFSKENYQVAAALTKETITATVESRLMPIPVTDVMISANRIVSYTLGYKKINERSVPETVDDVNLLKLRGVMQTRGFKRIPVLDQNGRFVAVVHNEPLVAFLLAAAHDETVKAALGGKGLEVITMGDVRKAQPQVADSFEKLVAFVARSQSLAEAKNAMEDVPGCQDVFVTQTGSRKETVAGWITNNEIIERLRT